MMLPSIAPPSATDSEVSRLANRLQQIGETVVSISEGNGGGSSLLPPQQQTQHQQISKEVSTSPQIAYLLLRAAAVTAQAQENKHARSEQTKEALQRRLRLLCVDCQNGRVSTQPTCDR